MSVPESSVEVEEEVAKRLKWRYHARLQGVVQPGIHLQVCALLELLTWSLPSLSSLVPPSLALDDVERTMSRLETLAVPHVCVQALLRATSQAAAITLETHDIIALHGALMARSRARVIMSINHDEFSFPISNVPLYR